MKYFCILLTVFFSITVFVNNVYATYVIDIFQNEKIQEVILKYKVSYLEVSGFNVDQTKDFNGINPNPNPNPNLIQFLNIKPLGKELDMTTEYSGKANNIYEERLLQSASSNFVIPEYGTSFPSQNASMGKMLEFFGRIQSGEWVPPLPKGVNDMLKKEITLIGFPMEGGSMETYTLPYIIKRDYKKKINGHHITKYSYSINGKYQKFLKNSSFESVTNNESEARNKLYQNFDLKGDILFDIDQGVLLQKSERIVIEMSQFKRNLYSSTWVRSENSSKKIVNITKKLNSLEFIYKEDF